MLSFCTIIEYFQPSHRHLPNTSIRSNNTHNDFFQFFIVNFEPKQPTQNRIISRQTSTKYTACQLMSDLQFLLFHSPSEILFSTLKTSLAKFPPYRGFTEVVILAKSQIQIRSLYRALSKHIWIHFYQIFNYRFKVHLA